MIAVSSEYRRQLIAGNRKWLVKANMTLADGTPLELKNENIWEGGVTIDEAISSDSSFDIGAAVIGSVKIVIDNITGNFSQYDFYDARLVLYLGVEGDVDGSDVQRYYRKGFYVVDKPTYNGSLITLDCLDNMTWFDIPFDEVTGIQYPATAGAVVQAICLKAGVLLGTPTFPNYSASATTIAKKPEQKLNCREVLQYIAQMCCCYCKISTAGELVLAWYDKNAIIGITNYDGGTFSTNTTPYSDGCDLDGGSFNPWNAGDSADGGLFTDLLNNAYLSNNFQIEVSTDDIIVTGCRVRNSTAKDNAYDELWVDSTIEQDHERYVLVIDNNPFIANQTQAAAVANIVGNTLAGLPIRGFSSSTLSDFSYETGDMATVIDFRGNRYYTWITSFSFSTTTTEQFSCGVESLRKRSEDRFSGTVKTLAEANENATALLSDYDRAVGAINELAQDAISYNEYIYPTTGNRVMWRYNGTHIDTTVPTDPKFPTDTTVVFKISGDGVFFSNDIDPTTGEVTYAGGFDANSGAAILSLIYVQGLNADWINAGYISANRIAANSITAGKLNVTTLSAITANCGTITAGTIQGTTISGSQYFHMSAKNADADHNSTLNWGESWQDSLTVEIDRNHNAGIGVQEDRYNAVYMHYNEILWYNDSSTPKKAVFESISSDKRLKKNIKNADGCLIEELFTKIRPVHFDYKEGDKDQYGLIAQELIKILDELGIDKSQIIKTDNDGFYEIQYSKMYRLSMLATHDLYKRMNKQQEEIDLLKKEVALLKEKVGV